MVCPVESTARYKLFLFPFDLDVRFIHTVAFVGRLQMGKTTLVQLGSIHLHPTPDTTCGRLGLHVRPAVRIHARRKVGKQEPSIADSERDDLVHFRVTHPFHPLFGQQFSLTATREGLPEDRLYFIDPQGSPASIHSALRTGHQ